MTHKDDPFHLPDQFKYWHKGQKLEFMLHLLDPLVDRLFVPVTAPPQEPVAIQIVGQRDQIIVPPRYHGHNLHLVINGKIEIFFICHQL
jgi:hypothetical protein